MQVDTPSVNVGLLPHQLGVARSLPMLGLFLKHYKLAVNRRTVVLGKTLRFTNIAWGLWSFCWLRLEYPFGLLIFCCGKIQETAAE